MREFSGLLNGQKSWGLSLKHSVRLGVHLCNLTTANSFDSPKVEGKGAGPHLFPTRLHGPPSSSEDGPAAAVLPVNHPHPATRSQSTPGQTPREAPGKHPQGTATYSVSSSLPTTACDRTCPVTGKGRHPI